MSENHPSPPLSNKPQKTENRKRGTGIKMMSCRSVHPVRVALVHDFRLYAMRDPLLQPKYSSPSPCVRVCPCTRRNPPPQKTKVVSFAIAVKTKNKKPRHIPLIPIFNTPQFVHNVNKNRCEFPPFNMTPVVSEPIVLRQCSAHVAIFLL